MLDFISRLLESNKFLHAMTQAQIEIYHTPDDTLWIPKSTEYVPEVRESINIKRLKGKFLLFLFQRSTLSTANMWILTAQRMYGQADEVWEAELRKTLAQAKDSSKAKVNNEGILLKQKTDIVNLFFIFFFEKDWT